MTSSMCRVCLVDNSRMLNVDNIYLLNMYEKLTNTKLNAEADSRMPSMICYVCHRQLQKCHRFFNMAHKSNRILSELLHNTDEEPHTTLITPSQEIMHHLVVTPTEHITIDICLNTTSISPVPVNEDLLTVKGETAKNKDIDDKALKFERLDEDIEKYISFNPKEHIINNCSNTTSISPVTVKEEELYVKKETVNEDIDDAALKETLDEDDETINDPNETEQSQENNIDVKSSSMDLCFYCDLCNKQMSNKNLLVHHLKDHMQVHTGGMLYSCNICEKAFSHKSNMTRHMRGHTKKKPYPCNSCDKSFNHIRNLTKHMRDHTGEKPYPCKSCDKAFTKISDLKRHMRVHTGEKPFSCNRCDKAFTQKSNLTFHMRVHTGEKPYPCNRCDKAFVKKEHLNRHMRVHTGEKPFSCNLCDKAFTDRSDLIKHTRVHTGEKPYPCNRCDKVFTQKCGLKRHMRVHNREKSFFCNTCEKTFTDEGKLTSHRRRLHTMEILIPATI